MQRCNPDDARCHKDSINRFGVDVKERSLKRVPGAIAEPRGAGEGAHVNEDCDLGAKGRQSKRRRDESEDLDRYMNSDEFPGPRKGPKILKTSGLGDCAHHKSTPPGFFDIMKKPIQNIIRNVASFAFGGIREPILEASCLDDPML
jgi:hypothetical protein